jgi:hypothetical protein
MNTMRSIGVPQPPSAQRRAMIAPVSIYDGIDKDWSSTFAADRTEIANYLEKPYTTATKPNIRIVHTARPSTLLLQIQLVGVESNVPMLSTVSRIYPAGLLLNIDKQASSSPGTFSSSVTHALTLHDWTSRTRLAAAANKKSPGALNLGSTLSTVRAAEAGIDQGATVVGKSIQLMRWGDA